MESGYYRIVDHIPDSKVQMWKWELQIMMEEQVT